MPSAVDGINFLTQEILTLIEKAESNDGVTKVMVFFNKIDSENHKERQNQITEEVLEVNSAFESLTENPPS